MNSAKRNQKKINEYTLEDIKEIFYENLRKISSKIILLEIGNDFLNIGVAQSRNNKIYIKKVFKQILPKEALEKSLPTEPVNFGAFLNQIINENKIRTNRVALSLPSDTCYTRLIEIPEEIEEENSIRFLENPNSRIQIPISLENSDFEINLTNLPVQKRNNKFFNKYFLTSIPKKNVDIILDSIKNANLELISMQMSHMCIANLLKTEIDKIKDDDLIISVDLLDEFTQFVIFDASGPLFIKRLASIKNYPSIEEIKKMNQENLKTKKASNNIKKSENYHALSKLDLKILIREINKSFNDFLNENNLNKKAKIFLSGRNSQHENLVEILGNSLKMDVSVISPINNSCLEEFSYNPDEINHFSMSRLIGLGLTLIKNNELEDESFNREFIIKSFSFQEDSKENLKIKDNAEAKTKKEEKKKELPPLPNLKIKDNAEAKTKIEEKKKELPPLPNLKIKDKAEVKTKIEEKKKELPPLPNLKIEDNSKKVDTSSEDNEGKMNDQKNKLNKERNKPFKMDKSFLKDD